MGYNIVVVGKGGIGKISFIGFLIDYLVKDKKGLVLVVDVDVNVNINEVLGIEVEVIIGEIREEVN